MRISKDLAGQIAYKLTEKSRQDAEVIKKEYAALVAELYEAKIPKEVADANKKHPEWFYKRQQVTFTGHGFSYERVSIDRSVIANNGTDCVLSLTDKISKQLMDAKRKYDKAEKEYKDLKKETETALINLGTFARIRENIPAAAPMLPPPMSNALVCNFDSLNKRLQKQLPATNKTVKA